MHHADYQEDQRTRNFWTYFPDIPVGSIFSFGGPTAYKKTGGATYREHCSHDRSERIYAEKDLGKLLKVIKVAIAAVDEAGRANSGPVQMRQKLRPGNKTLAP